MVIIQGVQLSMLSLDLEFIPITHVGRRSACLLH